MLDPNTIDECLKALISSDKIKQSYDLADDLINGEEYLTIEDITTILFNLKANNK